MIQRLFIQIGLLLVTNFGADTIQLKQLRIASLPFTFQQLTYAGYYPIIDSLGQSPWTPIEKTKSGIRRNEHPLPNSVIKF